MCDSVHAAPIGEDPYSGAIERLFAAPQPTRPCPMRNRYLQITESIVDQAASWVDERGVVVDPVEGKDRWRGGTAARFACPAAILIAERGRQDLLPVVTRAMDQLSLGILRWAAEGEDHPPGVLDLTVKEIVVAYSFLREGVPASRSAPWRQAIEALDASVVYTAEKTLKEGQRLHNYGVYASLGEWLRLCQGLGGDRAWLEHMLAIQLGLFTRRGMYRDPGDPMLYDLSVRQNLSELLWYGYDGEHQGALRQVLERGGMATLLSLSSCGHAPFGGRSNALLHNEAMVAYVCEFQARQWKKAGRPEVAAGFREAAARATAAAEPFAHERPLRFIKNWFDPQTRHGRDASYGEYAVYALLAASLFARTALVAADDMPALATPAASRGSLLELRPAFHKVFATCGDTHVEIDTKGQAGYDPTGLGRLHRQDAPPELGMSMGIAAHPKYIVHKARADRSAAIGPCWRTLAGEWRSLAELGTEIEEVRGDEYTLSPDEIGWELEWSLDSGARLPIASVRQRYRLSPGQLQVTATLFGVYERVGFEVPCLLTAGRANAKTSIDGGRIVVQYQGWVLLVQAADGEWRLGRATHANRYALYRVARLETVGPCTQVTLTLTRGTNPR